MGSVVKRQRDQQCLGKSDNKDADDKLVTLTSATRHHSQDAGIRSNAIRLFVVVIILSNCGSQSLDGLFMQLSILKASETSRAALRHSAPAPVLFLSARPSLDRRGRGCVRVWVGISTLSSVQPASISLIFAKIEQKIQHKKAKKKRQKEKISLMDPFQRLGRGVQCISWISTAPLGDTIAVKQANRRCSLIAFDQKRPVAPDASFTPQN